MPVNEDSGEKVLPEEWTYDFPQERVYIKEEDGTKLYSIEAVEKNVGHELDYETMSESSSEESSDDSSDEADAELESFKKKNAPKKPLSAYILFLSVRMQRSRRSAPTLTIKRFLEKLGSAGASSAKRTSSLSSLLPLQHGLRMRQRKESMRKGL